MNAYETHLSATALAALSEVAAGIVRVGVSEHQLNGNGFYGCEIGLASGKIIRIDARDEGLEYRFEVFPITANELAACELTAVLDYPLAAPVSVQLLYTQEWLDPCIPCEGAMGRDSIMVCQGRPGQAPANAIAACTYVGGVRFLGADGRRLTIATLGSPFAMHVSCFAGGNIDPGNYIAVAIEDSVR